METKKLSSSKYETIANDLRNYRSVSGLNTSIPPMLVQTPPFKGLEARNMQSNFQIQYSPAPVNYRKFREAEAPRGMMGQSSSKYLIQKSPMNIEVTNPPMGRPGQIPNQKPKFKTQPFAIEPEIDPVANNVMMPDIRHIPKKVSVQEPYRAPNLRSKEQYPEYESPTNTSKVLKSINNADRRVENNSKLNNQLRSMQSIPKGVMSGNQISSDYLQQAKNRFSRSRSPLENRLTDEEHAYIAQKVKGLGRGGQSQILLKGNQNNMLQQSQPLDQGVTPMKKFNTGNALSAMSQNISPKKQANFNTINNSKSTKNLIDKLPPIERPGSQIQDTHATIVPHYDQIFERNQRDFQDRMRKADERNLLIFQNALKYPTKTQSMALQDRDEHIKQLTQKQGEIAQKRLREYEMINQAKDKDCEVKRYEAVAFNKMSVQAQKQSQKMQKQNEEEISRRLASIDMQVLANDKQAQKQKKKDYMKLLQLQDAFQHKSRFNDLD